jgi:hypothetical protein
MTDIELTNRFDRVEKQLADLKLSVARLGARVSVIAASVAAIITALLQKALP